MSGRGEGHVRLLIGIPDGLFQLAEKQEAFVAADKQALAATEVADANAQTGDHQTQSPPVLPSSRPPKPKRRRPKARRAARRNVKEKAPIGPLARMQSDHYLSLMCNSRRAAACRVILSTRWWS